MKDESLFDVNCRIYELKWFRFGCRRLCEYLNQATIAILLPFTQTFLSLTIVHTPWVPALLFDQLSPIYEPWPDCSSHYIVCGSSNNVSSIFHLVFTNEIFQNRFYPPYGTVDEWRQRYLILKVCQCACVYVGGCACENVSESTLWFVAEVETIWPDVFSCCKIYHNVMVHFLLT